MSVLYLVLITVIVFCIIHKRNILKKLHWFLLSLTDLFWISTLSENTPFPVRDTESENISAYNCQHKRYRVQEKNAAKCKLETNLRLPKSRQLRKKQRQFFRFPAQRMPRYQQLHSVKIHPARRDTHIL